MDYIIGCSHKNLNRKLFKEGEICSLKSQAEMFFTVIKMFQNQKINYIDTFWEPNSMVNGFTEKNASLIHETFQSVNKSKR